MHEDRSGSGQEASPGWDEDNPAWEEDSPAWGGAGPAWDEDSPVRPAPGEPSPLEPGLPGAAPSEPAAGHEHPTLIYPGTPPPPPPPPPPGPYGPAGGGYEYPAAGYLGGATQPQAGFPGSAGYAGGGYTDGGYIGYPSEQAGYGMPGGYGGPADIIGYGQDRPPRRGNRIITYVLVAALAAGVGAGTVLAMRHTGTSPGFGSSGASAIPPPASGAGQNGGTSASNATKQAVASKVSPGIVDVISTPSYQPGGTLEGTGMILTSNGLVLTNNHVIEGTSHEVAKIADTGQQYNVTVLGTDKTDDVALLKLDGASNLRHVPIGNSSTVQVGQAVVALGNAEGQDGAPTVVTGTITDLDRSIQASDAGANNTENLHDMLQTDAPIVEGDSGGALANTKGQVIGMNTAANTQASGGADTSMGFAIPINRALAIARQIAAGHATTRIQIGLPAFLGVTVASSNSGPSTATSPQAQLQQLRQQASAGQGGLGGLGGGTGSSGGCLTTDQASVPQRAADVSSGALVGGVLCGTPVSTAGLTAGAVITGIDRQAITSPASLTKVLTGYHPGDSITLTWVSAGGQHRTSKLALIPGPAK